MGQKRFPQGMVVGILVAVFFVVAIYLRVVLPHDQVFVGDWIKFTGVDAYFQMRIIDNLAHNFPHLMTFDPYILYPGGSAINLRPFFYYFLAGIVWLVGLGSPTQHTIDVVGVYFPAVLGALTVIPVYFIGRALFNRWAGVVAAGLVGVFPGEFLGRSILGFTDYHVAEVLFTTITMLFLILAVKNAQRTNLNFSNVKSWGWPTVANPLIYSFLAGIFLGIYILTWQGALLFVFIIFAYLIVQFIVDHLRGRTTTSLCFVSTIVFFVSLLVFLPAITDRVALGSLIIAIIVPIVLAMLSDFMTRRGTKPHIYPVALIGIGLISLAIFYVIDPSLLRNMLGQLDIFFWPIGTTVLEMQPLLFPGGDFSLAVAFGNFTTSFFLSLIALGIIIYLVIKQGESDRALLVVWSLLILAATLSMRRFAYYFVVNAALLTGYLCWLIFEFSGFGKEKTEFAEAPKDRKKIKQKKRQRDGSRPATRRANMALGVIFVFFFVFYPNIGPLPGGAKLAIDIASHPQFAPSDAWCESLNWLRDNTPDPFDNPDFYYELPPPRKSYSYPKTAYGVTAWWDYGYWITRIGHRIPTSNPGTSHIGEAHFFVAQDESSANRLLQDKWKSKYIITDYAVAMPIIGKFHALASLSGSNQEKFYDVYYQPRGDIAEPVPLFYPEYYRSLVVRLYNFDGKQVKPDNCMVISYKERVSREGQQYKEITDIKSFLTYGEAEAYIANQKSGDYRIVGNDPFVSPVPLEALEHYKLVYSSNGSKMLPGGGLVPEVKIFEYIE